MHIQTKIRVIAAAGAALVSGCSSLQPDVTAVRSKAEQTVVSEMAHAEQATPVITSTSDAWLMGDAVEVEAPQSPLLDRVVTYHPSRNVTLLEVAEYVQQTTGIKVEAIDLQPVTPAASGPAVSGPGPLAPAAGTGANANQNSNAQRETPATKTFPISYEGKLSGLLDLATSKAGVWWKLEQGRLRYYQTETKTFYVPATMRVSVGSAQISASTGGDQGSGGGAAGAGGSGGAGKGSGGQSASLSGGTNSSSSYSVDKWAEMKEAATVISGGAAVAVNPGLGSISVTGTPNQVRHVEEWVKSLTDSLSQMVSISVRMYSVKLTGQDNYGWSPDIIFQGLKTQYGFSLTGQPPVAVSAGSSALNFAASVLSSATGSKAQYSGSQLAVQALAQLGEVNEILNRTIVTMNGEPAPLQVANQRGYIASQTAPATVPTGTVAPAPTLTTATITSGFTALFVPRVANGKIWMSMNITDSKLLSLDKAGGDTNLVQSPNVDLQTMQSSVRLAPGETLLLTGHQEDSGSSSRNGTGSPSNWLLGGGVGRNAGRQLIAIIVSAKVL